MKTAVEGAAADGLGRDGQVERGRLVLQHVESKEGTTVELSLDDLGDDM